MVQTSLDICNNVNLGPEMCHRRGGCLVVDQGGSDKVAQFKIEGRGPDPQFPHWIRACNRSQRVRKENGISSFNNLYFAFLRT